jgi:uncharacterized protein
MRMREAHYPGQAPIQAYGNGGFRFADMSHRGSIVIVPSGIYAWEVSDAAEISVATLKRVFDEPELPAFLLLGTGRTQMAPSAGVRLACTERGIHIEAMDTGAAVRTFNILLAERRSASAALIAVD